MCIHACIHACIGTSIDVRVDVCAHVCTDICVDVCVDVCVDMNLDRGTELHMDMRMDMWQACGRHVAGMWQAQLERCNLVGLVSKQWPAPVCWGPWNLRSLGIVEHGDDLHGHNFSRSLVEHLSQSEGDTATENAGPTVDSTLRTMLLAPLLITPRYTC